MTAGDPDAGPGWVETTRGHGEALLARLEASRGDHATIEIGFRWLLRDKEIAGGVLGGGLAYRFFFWVLALSLLLSRGSASRRARKRTSTTLPPRRG